MKDIRYLNVILTLLTVVMALNLAVAFTTGPSWASSAAAKDREVPTLPDASLQRVEIIDELKRLNKKADEVRDLIGSGRLSVRLSNARTSEE